MKKKFTTIVLIGVLIFGALGVSTATTGEAEPTQRDVKLIFSQPQFSDENEEYIVVEVSEADAVLMESGKPMLPRYTETVTFPFGTIGRPGVEGV